MNTADIHHAPPIEPVAEGIVRPRWSVMIPTYNCANYLRETLASVLAQDPGPDEMHIEVVDDCSTKDDPEAVVQELGAGRVQFYRRPQNGGATPNFNTCLQRSRGHLVHILHGDDYVLPKFYSTVSAIADAHPEVALIVTRSFYVDEESVIKQVSPRIPSLEAGGRDAQFLYYNNILQTPAVVIRRTFYEGHGGFVPNLVHTADQEMWVRAIEAGGGVMTKEVLACYRSFAANNTGRMMRSAENLRDIQRTNDIFAQRYPGFDSDKALAVVCQKAMNQKERFAKLGDREAAAVNAQFWQENAPLKLKLRQFLRALYLRFIKQPE